MPILFRCHRCDCALEVPDELTGKQARCPHCDIVCPVPANLPPLVTEFIEEPTPAPEPRSEHPQHSPESKPEPTTGPTPTPASVPIAPTEHSAPVLSLDDPEELPEELQPEPVKSASAKLPKSANPWEQLEERPGTRQAPWQAGAGRWRPFGEGCKFVWWGIAVELVGVALFFAILEAIVLHNAEVIQLPRDVMSIEFLLLPLFLPLMAGTLLIAIGRVMMLRVPPGTAAVPVLMGSAGLSWFRLLALLAATICVILATRDSLAATRGPYLAWTARTYGLAMLAGLVAEVSAVPALAVVGGEMPSRSLRSRAATATFVFQLMVGLWTAMIVSVVLVDALRELFPVPAQQPVQRPPPGEHEFDPETRAAAAGVVLAAWFALIAGYSFLHYSLYSAGQFAGRTDGDRQR